MGQERAERERVRPAAGAADARELFEAEVVEHIGDVGRDVRDASAGIR